jgi:hypothetical protein
VLTLCLVELGFPRRGIGLRHNCVQALPESILTFAWQNGERLSISKMIQDKNI